METWYNGQAGKTYREGVREAVGAEHDSDLEWVQIVLTADPGVRLEDIEDQAPPRKKEHRRVPSTVAIEEVKVIKYTVSMHMHSYLVVGTIEAW